MNEVINILKANYKYNILNYEEILEYLENQEVNEISKEKIQRLQLLAQENLDGVNLLTKLDKNWPEIIEVTDQKVVSIGLNNEYNYDPNSLIIWIDVNYYTKAEGLKYIISYFESIKKIPINFIFIANETVYQDVLDEKYSQDEAIVRISNMFLDHVFVVGDNSKILDKILDKNSNNNIYTLIASFAQKSLGYQKLIDYGATNITINNLERIINEISNR